MAFLKVIQGQAPSEIIELTGKRTVIGRHPDCEVVLDSAAVSRQHARILGNQNSYYLEDLRSRNRTLLNGEMVEGRNELVDGDSIQVCDVVFHFCEQASTRKRKVSNLLDQLSGPDSGEQVETLSEGFPSFAFDDAEIDDSSSIITTIDTRSSSQTRLGVQPEAKLRAVLEIGRLLASVLDLDKVFDKTLDGLFQIFSQADTGFVLLRKPDDMKKVVLKASKSRDHRDEPPMRISTTIVRQVMETGDAILSADAVADERFEESESVSELQINSVMCVPLIEKGGEAIGIMQLDSLDMRRPFSQDDLDVFASVTSQISLAVENARLHEQVLQQRETERDLEFATQIQHGFLPNQRPKIEGYELGDYYESALRVGGDYFDYVPLPGGRMAVALGDVAGKGIPAALLMARLYSSARFHLLTQPTLGEAFSGLNEEIAASGLGFRFITFVSAVLDPHTNEILIANAGHLAPLVRRCSGEVELIGKSESGMPLGVAQQEAFNEIKLVLEPGESLVLFTDGITEAINPDKEIYGRERLSQYLSAATVNAEELVSGIVGDVERFSDGCAQRDDICLVCLVRTA